jgi:hypothetical protein
MLISFAMFNSLLTEQWCNFLMQKLFANIHLPLYFRDVVQGPPKFVELTSLWRKGRKYWCLFSGSITTLNTTLIRKSSTLNASAKKRRRKDLISVTFRLGKDLESALVSATFLLSPTALNQSVY